MKKFTGQIWGFDPSFYSLRDGDKTSLWYGVINEAILRERILRFDFYWQGNHFFVTLGSITYPIYHGKIFLDDEEFGATTLALYENKNGYLLIGDWEEEEKLQVWLPY